MAAAIEQYVPAGCSPVRVALSPDRLTLYVSARNNNEVLTFDTTRFAADPMNALTGMAPAGAAPDPLALIDPGALLVIGNSNRFLEPESPQSLDVLDTVKLQAGVGGRGASPFGSRRAFPRASLLSPDDERIFLSNYDSNSLQVMDVGRLGAGPGRAGTGH